MILGIDRPAQWVFRAQVAGKAVDQRAVEAGWELWKHVLELWEALVFATPVFVIGFLKGCALGGSDRVWVAVVHLELWAQAAAVFIWTGGLQKGMGAV